MAEALTESAPFRYDAVLGEKAAIHEEGGDLVIEGYASDYDTDRDQEAFESGAFNRGLDNYLTTNPVLCYHHDTGKALGKVESARLDEKGLFIRARVDEPAAGSWAEDIVMKIKSGTIKAFSVGGLFQRRKTEKGWRIFDVDLAEISVTPVPVNPRTLFQVAGKAFGEEDTDIKAALDQVYRLERVIQAAERLLETPKTEDKG